MKKNVNIMERLREEKFTKFTYIQYDNNYRYNDSYNFEDLNSYFNRMFDGLEEENDLTLRQCMS